jgi:hypothetical protein
LTGSSDRQLAIHGIELENHERIDLEFIEGEADVAVQNFRADIERVEAGDLERADSSKC